MASEVEIYNRALSKLGAARVNSPTENTRNARACNNAYAIVRDALLREYRWAFAIKRKELAALGDAPIHGRDYQYQLPPDYLRLLVDDNELITQGVDDRNIEGDKIVTDEAGPLEIVYIARIEETSLFAASFVKALAADLAFEICEEITNSNSKKEALREDRKEAIRDGRRTGAIERRATHPREDSWLTAREGGYEDKLKRGFGA